MAEPNGTFAGVPTASGLAARLALAELRRRGIDPGPLLSRARLSLVALDHSGRIHVRSQIEFLELASRAVGDDFFGLTLAAQFDLRELGIRQMRMERRLYLVYRQDRPLPAAAQALVDVILPKKKARTS